MKILLGMRVFGLYRLLFYFLLMRLSSPITAQAVLCDGNLGDNIFTAGDFGSGTPVVVQNDPGLAPGFQYTTQVPPDDGEYTLTNRIANWPYVYPTWLTIGDNDFDPNGYMMVVNASFAPGVFYQQIIDNLCENTVYEFTADVINLIKSGTTGHTLPNVSFLIDGVIGYSTGGIPQDEDWHTYGYTFVTGPGQFAVTLSLRNNAPGGTGNDLALDNISFKACGPESALSVNMPGKICENEIFPLLTAHIDADTGAIQWQRSDDLAISWTDIPGAIERTYQVPQLATGQYYFRFLYSNTISSINNPKCRTVSAFVLVQVVPVMYMITDTICEGMTVSFGGIDYGQSGMYQALFTASNGCDSLVTLDLVVVPDPPIIANFQTIPPTCLGAQDGKIFIADISGVSQPYVFSIDGVAAPSPDTFLFVPAGSYSARVENKYGCFTEEQVEVQEGSDFMVFAIGDTTILLGHEALLIAFANLPVTNVLWTPSESMSCPTCLETFARPLVDQTYVVTATGEGGCIDTAEVTIIIDRTPLVYIPNIFSPNGDQLNDYFSITLDPLNIISIDEFAIFDRWGDIIAQKTDITTQAEMVLWDGNTSKGPASSGMYVYTIRFALADGSASYANGDINLLR